MKSLCEPNLVVRAAIMSAFLFASARPAFPQSPPPPPPGVVVTMPDKADPSIKIPEFEVISVKPSKEIGTRVQFTPDGLRGTAVTTRFLLFEGFGGINQNQLIGEPSWSTADGFDIEAKVAAADVPVLAKLTFEQRRTMFQQILTERFQLASHHETRELPIYQLTIGRKGSRLKSPAPEDPAQANPRRRGVIFGPGKVTATDGSMSMLVTLLSRQLGRVVVDKTGLAGVYDSRWSGLPKARQRLPREKRRRQELRRTRPSPASLPPSRSNLG